MRCIFLKVYVIDAKKSELRRKPFCQTTKFKEKESITLLHENNNKHFFVDVREIRDWY